MLLKQAIDEFLQNLEERDYSIQTIKGYKCDLSAFMRFLDEIEGKSLIKVKDVQSELVGRFLANNNGNGTKTSAASRNRRLYTIRSLSRFLLEKGILNKGTDITQGIKFSRIKVTEPSFLTHEEYLSILNAIHLNQNKYHRTRDWSIIVTLHNTGLRLAELVALDVEQFDERGGKLLFVKRKGGAGRDLPVNENVVRGIRYWLHHRPHWHSAQFGPLFVSRRGSRISARSVEYLVGKYVKAAGLTKKVTPHTFRHSHCTELQVRGVDIETVRRLLAHKSLKTTARYSHTSEELMRNAVKTLNDPRTWLEMVEMRVEKAGTPYEVPVNAGENTYCV